MALSLGHSQFLMLETLFLMRGQWTWLAKTREKPSEDENENDVHKVCMSMYVKPFVLPCMIDCFSSSQVYPTTTLRGETEGRKLKRKTFHLPWILKWSLSHHMLSRLKFISFDRFNAINHLKQRNLLKFYICPLFQGVKYLPSLVHQFMTSVNFAQIEGTKLHTNWSQRTD